MNSILIRGIIILILITISFVISKSRNKFANISYMIITTILSAYGFMRTWMLTRELDMELLRYHLDGHIDYEFMIWAFHKYKVVAVISLYATTAILFICSLASMFMKRKHVTNNTWIVYLVNIYRIIIIVFSMVYSYFTFNKHFSLVNYIVELAIAQCLIVYQPLIMKRRWYDK